MAELVIFGTGDNAELAYYYFKHDTNHNVAAFTVDGAYVSSDRFCDRPVVAFEDLAKSHPPDRYKAFVAIGYTMVNRVRAEKCAAMQKQGFELVSYVSPKATTFPDLTVGWNCFILEDNTIQWRVRIGNDVVLWSGNHLGHHSTIEDHVFVASHVVISGGVTVGASTFIGVNSTIRDHVKIGRSCVIGAGSLISGDVEDESVFSEPRTEKSRVPSSRLRRI